MAERDILELRSVRWLDLTLTAFGFLAGVLALIFIPDLPMWAKVTIAAGVVCVLLLFLWFLAELHGGRSIKALGIVRFIRDFSAHRSGEAFHEVESELWYLGVSFHSVMAEFKMWYLREKRGDPRIRLLLMDPEAIDALEFQARYERNLMGAELSESDKDLLVNPIPGRIANTREEIANIGSPQIEIRYHREPLREWMYIINGTTAYVGFLKKGDDGLRAPVMELRDRKGWSLFRHFKEEFEALWEEAKPASDDGRPHHTRARAHTVPKREPDAHA